MSILVYKAGQYLTQPVNCIIILKVVFRTYLVIALTESKFGIKYCHELVFAFFDYITQ